MDGAGISIGLITQVSDYFCGQPRIPLKILGFQVARHEDGKTAAKAGRQVRIN